MVDITVLQDNMYDSLRQQKRANPSISVQEAFGNFLEWARDKASLTAAQEAILKTNVTEHTPWAHLMNARAPRMDGMLITR